MKHNNYHNMLRQESFEDDLIDNFALPNAVLAPTYAALWIVMHDEMLFLHKWIFGANALLYVLIYLLLKFAVFRRYRRIIYQTAYIITNTVAIYLTYANGFKMDYTLMLLMISAYICLSFEDYKLLISYLIIAGSCMSAILLSRIRYGLYYEYELTFVLSFLVLAIAAVTLRKTRDRDLVKMFEMAHYDTLTGLANRRYLQIYLKEILKERVNEKQCLTAMFIDIDNFKKINDTMGHYYGDSVLAQIAKLISQCLSEEDFLAKYGGDEFVAILPGADPAYAEKVAKSIIEALSKPLLVSNKKNEVSASIGISLYPKDARTGEELLRKADIAMYYGKASGKNTYHFFNKEIREVIYKKSIIEQSLKNALARSELELYYQPVIELSSGTIIGAEALLRWRHPEYGIVYPSEFIPLAEENGLIISIGEWVLASVCHQNKAWQQMGLHPITIAVNVSYHQLKYSNYIGFLEKVLKESGLEPKYLELEITESILREAMDLKSFVDELKKLGIRLAIDDFGVGYSSLNILQHVDFNNLKIDMSFLREVPENPKAAAMVKTIIEIGRIIESKITAEGVENSSQVEFLRKNGCNNAQGYFFHSPQTTEQFTDLLGRWKELSGEW